jgi:hypothetical protein
VQRLIFIPKELEVLYDVHDIQHDFLEATLCQNLERETKGFVLSAISFLYERAPHVTHANQSSLQIL